MSTVSGSFAQRVVRRSTVASARPFNDDLIVFIPLTVTTDDPGQCDRSIYQNVHDMRTGAYLTTFSGATAPGPTYPSVRRPNGWNPAEAGGGLKINHNNVLGRVGISGLLYGPRLDDITVSFWMVSNSTAGTGNATGDNWKTNPHIVDKLVTGDDDNDFAVVWRGGSGLIQFVTGATPGAGSDHVLEAATNIRTATSGQTFQSDDWHHVACVRRKSDGLKKIYIDGAEDASTTNSAGVSMTNSNPLIIGTNLGNSASFRFSGYIAYFMLYRAALTADEVYSLWHPSTRFLEIMQHRSIQQHRLALGLGEPKVVDPPDPVGSLVNVHVG